MIDGKVNTKTRMAPKGATKASVQDQATSQEPTKNRPHATRQFPGGNLVLKLKTNQPKNPKSKQLLMCKERAGDVFKKLGGESTLSGSGPKE